MPKFINNLIASLIVGGLITGIIASIVMKDWVYLFVFVTSFMFLKLQVSQHLKQKQRDASKIIKDILDRSKGKNNDDR